MSILGNLNIYLYPGRLQYTIYNLQDSIPYRNWESSLSPNRFLAEANSISVRSQTVEAGLSLDAFAEANVDPLQ